jgi:hypothetical protein
MENLAARLHAQTGVLIDILPADLTNYNDLARVEARLREDSNLLPRSPSPSAYGMSHSTVERGTGTWPARPISAGPSLEVLWYCLTFLLAITQK